MSAALTLAGLSNAQAGFSTNREPWLPIPPDYRIVNVQALLPPYAAWVATVHAPARAAAARGAERH
jgi:hypothetical protein